MSELQRLTGRHNAEDIQRGLVVLEKSIYIAWENKSKLQSIKILEGWERENSSKPNYFTGSNVDYWTGY
ncbi:hypothetical protein [Paenibacillus sp. SN-8-1]|uniref:hypothetical protein n=1 Tax=Paenibacillus sp. SN-8-1 TaxID=3435409 RepID=UPI003D9A6D23